MSVASLCSSQLFASPRIRLVSQSAVTDFSSPETSPGSPFSDFCALDAAVCATFAPLQARTHSPLDDLIGSQRIPMSSWTPRVPPTIDNRLASECDDESISVYSLEDGTHPARTAPRPVRAVPSRAASASASASASAAASDTPLVHPRRDRVYECTAPNCDKAFAKKWNLQAHERLHTGHKPFQCRLGCGERHMWMSSLKSHERRKCRLLPESQRFRRKTRAPKSLRKARSDPTVPPHVVAEFERHIEQSVSASLPDPVLPSSSRAITSSANSVRERTSNGGMPPDPQLLGAPLDDGVNELQMQLFPSNAAEEQIVFELEHILSSK